MANPKIQLRHDTSTNWQTQNPVLLEGEVAIETDSNKVKIGNGTDNYNTLPYITDQTKIDLDYSNADYQPVNKSGDTMTGQLYITSTDARIDQNNTAVTKGTNPSSTKYWGMMFNGASDGSATWQSKRLGMIEHYVTSNGDSAMQLAAIQNVANSQTMARLLLSMTQAGVASCSFPNTTCCDGQYVNTNTTIASNVSVNGSSHLTYTLNLPSDGHNYMVWIIIEANTGTTSGNYVNAKVGSDIMASYATLARATTRTASSVSAGSTACIVVSSSHKIYLGRTSNWNGTVNLYMIGYRRIGTNS